MDDAEALRGQLRVELLPAMQAQLDGYWRDYVMQMR